MLLLIILLVLLFGGGGGYYGYSRWGSGGGMGVVGTVLLIVLLLYLFGGLRLYQTGECKHFGDEWMLAEGESMSFGLYSIGFAILIGGLIYAAYLVHMPAHWIAVG